MARKPTKKNPEVIRVTHLAKSLNAIHSLFKVIGGEQLKMAEIVINAIRTNYAIPVEGEQLEGKQLELLKGK